MKDVFKNIVGVRTPFRFFVSSCEFEFGFVWLLLHNFVKYIMYARKICKNCESSVCFVAAASHPYTFSRCLKLQSHNFVDEVFNQSTFFYVTCLAHELSRTGMLLIRWDLIRRMKQQPRSCNLEWYRTK